MPKSSGCSTEWSSTNASDDSSCRKCKKKSKRRSSSKKSKRRSSSDKKDEYNDNGYELLYEEEVILAPKETQKSKKPEGSPKFSEVESTVRSSSNASTSSLQPAKLVKPSETSIDSIDNVPSDDNSYIQRRVQKYPDSDFCRPELAPTEFFVGGASSSQIGSLRENSYRESNQAPVGKSETSSKHDVRELTGEYFVGALKERQLRKILKPNEFRLYYKIPRSRNDITVTLPLQLAYMSIREKVYHYPVLCSNSGTSKQAWSIGKESASFSSLSALIRYYQIYSYLNPETGTVEIFPTTNRSRSRRSHN
jgi:hypothetical protein